MNLLITGCCGHIGSHLANNVHKIKKIKKTCRIENFESNRFYSIFISKKKNNLHFLIRDLKNRKSLNDIKKIHYVIHLASMTNAEKFWKKRIKCMKTILNV